MIVHHVWMTAQKTADYIFKLKDEDCYGRPNTD